MSNQFEGGADERQAGEIAPSRFRPRYRKLSADELALHDAIKAKAAELEALFEQARAMRFPPLPLAPIEPGVEPIVGEALLGADYFGDGMRELELAVMWTVKGLTS